MNDMTENNLAGDVVGNSHGGSVARAATDIRELILRRSLLPGEQVRQEELAKRIGTSRGPIREALQVLAVEGIVRYERNRGYFVTRFTTAEMQQLYLIRDLLESEILSQLPALSGETIEELRAINERIRSCADDADAVIRLNREFHDLVTQGSPLNLLKGELQHIGRMTVAYQSLSINSLTDWELLVSDHAKIIAALEAHDNALLVEVSRVHRETSLKRLAPVLG
jgi:DNA-binding GntR family transcriptional regulator